MFTKIQIQISCNHSTTNSLQLFREGVDANPSKKYDMSHIQKWKIRSVHYFHENTNRIKITNFVHCPLSLGIGLDTAGQWHIIVIGHHQWWCWQETAEGTIDLHLKIGAGSIVIIVIGHNQWWCWPETANRVLLI